MEIEFMERVARPALVRGVIRTPEGHAHRCIWRTDTGQGDCDCEDENCPAPRVLADAPVREAETDKHATASSSQLRYHLTGNQLQPRVHRGENAREITPNALLATPAPRFVNASDARWTNQLVANGMMPDEGLVIEIAQSGRLPQDGHELFLGEDRPGTLTWHWHADGSQSLRFDEAMTSPSFLHLARIDQELIRLLHAGRWREPALDDFQQIPVETIADLAIPDGLPKPFRPVKIIDDQATPTGCVTIDGTKANAVTITYHYADTAIDPAFPASVVVAQAGDSAVRMQRDFDTEQRLAGEVAERGLNGSHLPGGVLGLARFCLLTRSQLEEAGWRVTVHGEPRIGAAETLVSDADGTRFRSGELLATATTQALDCGDDMLLRTESGDVIRVPKSLLTDVLVALGGQKTLRTSRIAGIDLDVDADAEAADVDLQAMRDAGNATPPATLTAQLRSYQTDGFGWLARLHAARAGGILADDMGLGKTLQTLSLLAHLAEQDCRPSLVVAPASLISNWQREARRFAPRLKTLVYYGPKRKASPIRSCDVAFTTYGVLRSDQKILEPLSFEAVILDEAHQIKNPRSKAAQAARALTATTRLALTGTPMENHLGELWSLFRFAQPGLLEPESAFRESFRRPIESGDTAVQEILARRIAPFMLRRTRGEVLKELPPLIESDVEIRMKPEQRAVYEALRASSLADLNAADDDTPAIERQARALEILTRLRQACCAPELLPADFPGRDAGSAKLDRACQMLLELAAEGRSVLVFSQFTSLLDLLAARLKQVDVPWFMLTGASRNRQQTVDAFQAGERPVFLISLKAGGAGLNLTRADTVILLDPWWNPAVEDQAAARAHRMGQTDPVFVYRLIATDTVEDAIRALKHQKADLTDQLTSELAALKPTDPEVMRQLLGEAPDVV